MNNIKMKNTLKELKKALAIYLKSFGKDITGVEKDNEALYKFFQDKLNVKLTYNPYLQNIDAYDNNIDFVILIRDLEDEFIVRNNNSSSNKDELAELMVIFESLFIVKNLNKITYCIDNLIDSNNDNEYLSRYVYNLNFIFHLIEKVFIKYLLNNDTTNPSFYEYKRRLTDSY